MINLDTLQIERTLDSGPDPELFALDQQGNKLYIANEDNAMVTVLDLTPGSTPDQIQVGVEPEGMAVSPDDKYLVATSETTSMAHFIDLATLQVVASVLVDARPRFAAFTPDGKYVLVSSEIGGTVAVIDVATKKIDQEDRLRDPGRRQADHPGRRRQYHGGWQDGLRRPRTGEPGGGRSTSRISR